MAYKVFLDANILLDFTLKRNDYDQSKKIISFVVNGQMEGFITPAIVHIVGYWLAKSYGNEKTKELLLSLLADVNIIDIPHEIVIEALHSNITDIEDALQYHSAIYHKLDCFISRDKQFQKEGSILLPVYSPEQFLTVVGF